MDAPQVWDSTEDNAINRLFYCLDNIVGMIPDEMRNHPMAQMLVVFAREGKKDIRRMPAEYVIEMSRQIGSTLVWVADGSLDDIPNEDTNEDDST